MEELSLKILDSLSTHIAVIDNIGVITYINKSWNNFYEENNGGLTNIQSKVGDNYLKHCLIASKKSKEALESYEGIKLVIDGKLDRFTNKYPTNDNKWYTINIEPLKDSGSVVIAHKDITKQVIAEEEIRKTKNKLELIANNIGDIVYKVTLDGDVSKIDYISNNVMDILGFTTDDYIKGNPKLVKSMYPKRYAEAVKFNKMIKTMKVAKPHSFDYEWFNPKKKKWLWMCEIIVPEIKNGKVVGQFGTVRDITEKKIADEKLKESEDRLNMAITSASLGVWDWDVQNNILLWDYSMYELYDEKKSDFTGAFDAWEKTLHKDDLELANKEVEKALSGEKEFNTVFRIITSKGDCKHIQAKANVQFDENNEPVRMLGVNYDITEKVLMEKEKRYAIIKTEEAERRRIAYDLHDGLGQKISAVNMYINALDDYVQDQLDEDTLSIFKVGKRLMNEAAIETRLVSHNIMPRSLSEYGLEQTLKEILSNYQKINKNTELKLESNLGKFRFDSMLELAIFRVLQEGLNNALKHSQADKINVILKLNEKKLFIEVNDNGNGFDYNEMIKKEDRGLGLVSLDQRVRMLGGKLIIDTQPSKGTKMSTIINLSLV